MRQKVTVGVIMGLIVVASIGFMVLNPDNLNPEVATTQSGTSVETQNQNPTVIEEVGEVGQTDNDIAETAVVESEVTESLTTGVYTEYDASLLANAENGNVVLFFHAPWCPSCRALDSSIQANRDALPADVTILQVDYDTATELKRKYGVVRQHTLVQVDAEGNEVQTLTGLTNTLDQVLSQI